MQTLALSESSPLLYGLRSCLDCASSCLDQWANEGSSSSSYIYYWWRSSRRLRDYLLYKMKLSTLYKHRYYWPVTLHLDNSNLNDRENGWVTFLFNNTLSNAYVVRYGTCKIINLLQNVVQWKFFQLCLAAVWKVLWEGAETGAICAVYDELQITIIFYLNWGFEIPNRRDKIILHFFSQRKTV
jgi:hypothetical protein